MSSSERRKFERVKLFKPVRGRVGKSWVFINEIGVDGFRIAHQGTLPMPGKQFQLEIDWEGRLLQFECEIVHNDLQKLAKTKLEKSVYQAGAHIVKAEASSMVALRKIVAEYVERALDEQRANARGLPPTAVMAYQTGKTTEYIRCELVNGTWRKSTTSRSDQPADGFTISSDEKDQVDTLCANFLSADEAGRKMIRMMAEASISSAADGIPTRRYTP